MWKVKRSRVRRTPKVSQNTDSLKTAITNQHKPPSHTPHHESLSDGWRGCSPAAWCVCTICKRVTNWEAGDEETAR